MFMVAATTYVPFLQSIGLTLSDVSWVNGWFWAAIVVFEVVTGMWADSHSRIWTIRMGALFFIFGHAIFFFADNIWWVLAAEMMNGVGFAFLSGVLQAWVVDALKHHGLEDQKGEVFANAAIVKGALSAPAAILGAWIGAHFGLRWPWVLSALAAVAGLIIVVLFMNGDGEVKAEVKVNKKEALRRSLMALRMSPALRWSTAAGLAFNMVLAFNHYWPRFYEQYVSVADLAYVWSPLYFALFLAGVVVRRAQIPSGAEASALVLSLVVSGVGLAAMGYAPGLGMLIVLGVVHEAGRGAFQPLTSSYSNHHVSSEYRATFGSLQALIEDMGAAVVLFTISGHMNGRADSPENIRAVWLGAGVLLVALAVILYFLRPKQE